MNYEEAIINLSIYAKSSATSQVYQRGKRIYETGEFQLQSLSLEQEEATYEVYGTKKYQTGVFDFLDPNGEIESDCTCPSDWSAICKHEVAIILDLMARLKKDSESSHQKTKGLPIKILPVRKAKRVSGHNKQKSRKSTEPIELKGFNKINTQNIVRLADPREAAQTTTPKNVVIKYHQLGHVSFQSHKRWYDKVTVDFFYEDNVLYSTCDCYDSTEGLCRHQIATLVYITNNQGVDFFKKLNPKGKKKEMQRLADWANIPIGQFEKYFDYDISTGHFLPKGKLKGLINFKKATPQVNFTFTNNRKWFIPNSVLDVEEDEINYMAYVINVAFQYNYIPTLSPIAGRKAKDGDLKNVKDYFNSPKESLQTTTKDTKILSLNQNRSSSHYYYSPSYCLEFKKTDDHKHKFELFKEITELLATVPYTYIRDCKLSTKLRKRDLSLIRISSTPAELFFELSEKGDLLSLAAKIKTGEKTISLAPSSLSKTLVSAFFIKNKETLYLHKNFAQVLAIQEHVAEVPVLKAKLEDADLFFEQIVQPIAEAIPVSIKNLKTLKLERVKMIPNHKQLFISDLGNFVIFEPVIIYDKNTAIKLLQKGDPFKKEKNTVTAHERDPEAEKDFLDTLATLHPDFAEQHQHDFFFLTYDQLLENDWFFKFFENIEDDNIEVFGVNDLKRLKYSPHRATVATHIKSGIDWFDVEIKLTFGKETVSLADLRKAVVQKSRFIRLKDGKLGILPEKWIKRFEAYFRLGEIKGKKIKVSKYKFTLIDQLFNEISDQKIIKELAAKRKKLKEFNNIKKVALSKNITAKLRPYQKEGVNWLHFLDEFQWGGILADDMGLGKTVQILSLLQNQIDKKNKPNLVVVPTSLLFNWQNEFQKFAPKIKYHIHYGSDRSKNIKELAQNDVVLTTYGIMMRDIELLKSQKFNYVILDESQAIKNVLSQRYKAACLLQANNRIAMTGTPIENNTFDLFAQMNFLNPGFFGSQAGFKRDYSKPIDAHQDSERAQELQKLISPFVLRRTKEQVAKDLPPKIEDYIYVNLEDNQRKVYEAYRNQYRDMLLGKIEEDGLNKSKMYVLEGLTKLRLICDSPALIKDENYIGESAKIKALIEHISDIANNHKMLVFSQFTKMLALVKDALDKEGIPYEYLDGKRNQKQRKASVENFQTNPEIRVFLLSLKAGNTGLNLTAADYVFLLDPWWNPAVESQAIDRTHRIGQDKHVIAYRIIAKDTIEEKILKLQQRKKKLASDLIQTDESFMKSIQQKDIVELFS